MEYLCCAEYTKLTENFAETKLDYSFPNAQFLLENYEIRNRKDRKSHGGGLLEYVRKRIICKEIDQSELDGHEIISSEVTIRNKKWAVFSVYRPLNSNVKVFIEKLETCLNKALSRYDNLLIMGNLNIDTQNLKDAGFNALDCFCDTLNLRNLIKNKTCFTKTHQSSIDVILTNKPRSFMHSYATETG